MSILTVLCEPDSGEDITDYEIEVPEKLDDDLIQAIAQGLLYQNDWTPGSVKWCCWVSDNPDALLGDEQVLILYTEQLGSLGFEDSEEEEVA